MEVGKYGTYVAPFLEQVRLDKLCEESLPSYIYNTTHPRASGPYSWALSKSLSSLQSPCFDCPVISSSDLSPVYAWKLERGKVPFPSLINAHDSESWDICTGEDRLP